MKRAAALALLLLLALAGTAHAVTPRTSLDAIEDEVMCITCGTALNISEAPSADREREFIKRQIALGKTKAQIKAALVEEYGRNVLAVPASKTVWVIPAVAAALLIGLLVTDTRSQGERTSLSRGLSGALSAVLITANLVALGILVHSLVDPSASGTDLLLGAVQVWLTNVIGFSLLYWELDRGGPVARRQQDRDQLPSADWRFSQDENDDAVDEVARGASGRSGWIPVYVDYLYLSLTNSSAFSPTDTMPLSSRAKLLMGVQATAALFVTLLVIARAVSALGG